MSILQKIAEFWPEFTARLTSKSDRQPIETVAQLHDFIASRSAFVAQKTLYGYLKTRMGTRYPTVFEDDDMIASINIAKMHVYAACVADLAVYCVTHATADLDTDKAILRTICLDGYDAAIAKNIDDGIDEPQRTAWRDAFAGRLDEIDWLKAGEDAEYGLQSPAALLKWAPIAPELKKLDVEIVRNSVRFAWHEVRAQFRNRCDRAAIMAELDEQNRS